MNETIGTETNLRCVVEHTFTLNVWSHAHILPVLCLGPDHLDLSLSLAVARLAQKSGSSSSVKEVTTT